jgi:ElaB/YqjD/DUF883 family membrane-anchored ribosome-binding protein
MDAAKLQENLAEGVGRVQEKLEQNVRQRVEQTRGALSSLNDRFGSFVQESPLLAIAGAFGAGYVVARIARAFT